MKRLAGILLSTVSAAVVTAAVGRPAAAVTPPADADRPIERLASIREAYLSTLASEWSMPVEGSEDQVAQFRNFPNFPNFSNWRNR